MRQDYGMRVIRQHEGEGRGERGRDVAEEIRGELSQRGCDVRGEGV